MFGGTTVESRVAGGPISVDMCALDDVGHGRALVDLDLLSRQVEAARIELVASALVGQVHTADGHRDVAAWTRATLDVARSTSIQWTRRGCLAVDHPDYLGALRDGRIHIDHYDEIVRAHANPRARGLLANFVDEFVAAAASLAFPDFQRMITLWVQLADDTGREPSPVEDSRHITVRRRRDGSCRLTGQLTAEQTAAFQPILDKFFDAESALDRQREKDAAEAGIEIDPPRTTGQRRADAFMALVTQAVAAQPGEPAKPLVRLHIGWRTLRDVLCGSELDHADLSSMRERLCRTEDGQPLTPAQILAAMITGNVQALVLDAAGHPFAMGRPGSLFTGKQREAILSLHAECAVAGCHAPHRHLEADHVVPRSRGGPTSAGNAAGVCARHNTWRFNHGYHLHRSSSGRWTTTRPDGTPLTDAHLTVG